MVLAIIERREAQLFSEIFESTIIEFFHLIGELDGVGGVFDVITDKGFELFDDKPDMGGEFHVFEMINVTD